MARPVGSGVEPASEPAEQPLSAENLRELELARLRSGRIRRAVSVARFNGWSVGIFAAFTLPFGLFSITALLLGLALAVVSYNEFAGAKALGQFDLRAPRRLGWNQLGFCGVLIVYCLWSVYAALTGPNPLEEAQAAAGGAAADLLGSFEDLHTMIMLAVYGGVLAGSIIFQGGTAWYYFTRRRHLQAYVSDTPPWVLELQRSTGTM
ncbi:MAG: hypothetical protein KKB50_14930 [Planctomycetes bacterium]|nr:hypothetical protein [Planctomycetota bacterium]